jgi:hypothetical protein
MLYGDTEEDVIRQWKEEARLLRFLFTPWKIEYLAVTPFNKTCIGASSVENQDFDIRLSVRGQLPVIGCAMS